ncbi:MAG: 50S ribosomal protein L5 [Patescibacteria group bacterium]|nr:50S ribosomal protein L5 [Patescibacteria group bacterium]
MNRLKEKYLKEIKKTLMQEFGIKNIHAVPSLVKVVINSGIGAATKNKELMQQIKFDLALISGQLPSIRLANVSVASFGIRRGMPVGMKVTLRRERMYAFVDRFFSIVLPRFRDFRGVSLNGFDQQGNYTIGIAEHTVFPEIDLAKSKPFGMEITFVTNAKDKEHSRRLLELLGMPFEK